MLVWLPFRAVGKNIGSRAICATRSPARSVLFTSKAGEKHLPGGETMYPFEAKNECTMGQHRAETVLRKPNSQAISGPKTLSYR